MKPSEVVDELTYRSYAWNRRRSPGISPERWAKVFGESAAQMEHRFAKEKHGENHEKAPDR